MQRLLLPPHRHTPQHTTHTHSCPRSISLPSYSPRLHRPPTLRQVCRISKLAGLRVIVPAPHVHTIIITHHHHHTPSSRTKFMPARRHAACAHETHPFHPRSSVTDKRQSRVGLLMALIAPVATRTHMSPTCTAQRAVHPAPPIPAPRSSRPVIHRTWATWQGARACRSTAAAV